LIGTPVHGESARCVLDVNYVSDDGLTYGSGVGIEANFARSPNRPVDLTGASVSCGEVKSGCHSSCRYGLQSTKAILQARAAARIGGCTRAKTSS